MGSYTKRFPANIEEAETVAIAALGHLAADPELLGRFLSITGLGPETIRAASGEPRFLAAVTTFMMTNEPIMLAFVANQGYPLDAVANADQLLTGELYGE